MRECRRCKFACCLAGRSVRVGERPFGGSKMRKLFLTAVAASLSAQAAAQDQGATLYSKGHFTGSSMTIAGPTTKMTPFQVKSLRIPSGTVWELCSGNTFTGCERFSESKAAIARTVRSVRPVAPPIAESVAVPGQGPVAGSGPSLRGLASEFFVVPAQDGARIEVSDKEPARRPRRPQPFVARTAGECRCTSAFRR